MSNRLLFLPFFLLIYSACAQVFQVPLNVSLPGENAQNPQIAFDGNGNGICVWSRSNGLNTIIQASRTTDGGLSWDTPQDLSLPLADAITPQIAFNGSIAICVWLRFDGSNNIVQAARTPDSGISWDPPQGLSLTGGDADQPDVTFDCNGNAICTWNRFDGANTVVQSARTGNGGISWDPAQNISIPGQDAFSSHLASDCVSTVICTWVRFDGLNFIIQEARTINGGANFSAPIDISLPGQNSFDPQIDFNDTNNAICVWEQSDGINTIIHSSTTADAGLNWSTPIPISLPGHNALIPQIALDGNANAICVWERSDGSNFIIQAAITTNGGLSFSAPINLSLPGQDAFNPQVVFNDSTAFIVWQRSNGTNFIIQGVLSEDKGTTFSAQTLSLPGHDSTLPQIAFDSSGNIISVWQGSDGSNTIIQAGTTLTPFSLSVFAKQYHVESLFQIDIVNKVSWNNIPAAIFYKVFNDQGTLLFQGPGLSFFDHDKKCGKIYTYFVNWINGLGNENALVEVRVP